MGRHGGTDVCGSALDFWVSGPEQAGGDQSVRPTKCHSRGLGPCPVGWWQPPGVAEHRGGGSEMIFQNI